ncbi:hypothetical protein [Candidatus Binatus sp.]|uniref:hypothetical protein n=1 Tax=Candidatus Binatus sp. TaxID=2811406 RepID=UPI002F9557E3
MPTTLKTARGIYAIASAAPIARAAGSVVVTLGLERGDGIEKFALRCRIATGVIGNADSDSPEKLIERIAPWLEREFEQTREAALKSIRTERQLLEISFDQTNRGPF